MRKLVAGASAALLALLLVACTPEEADHLKAVNDLRNFVGVPTLAWEEAVYPAAQAWSKHMADEGKLSHPSSLSGNFNPPAGWKKLGQNVAVATTLDAAMDALVNSPPHLANLLSRDYDRIAVGVVQQDGRFWVTENFVG
jgi:uncharacterized protein YkwD